MNEVNTTKYSLKKWIFVYVSVILFGGYVLFPATWGLVGGIIGGKQFSSPSFQSELVNRMHEEPSAGKREVKGSLSKEKQGEIEVRFRNQLVNTNWLPIHLVVNIVAFAVLSFITGFILRDFLYSGLIPLAMLYFTLPVLSSEEFTVINKTVTIAITLLTQMTTVYLFSYVGYRIRLPNL